MTKVSIGVDIGTTSVKAVAVDENGRVLSRARVPHELRLPAADRLEHDAAVAWVDGTREALHQVQAEGAVGVGVAAMVPTLTAVDATGRPLDAGLLYGDARGRTQEHAAPSGMGGEAVGFLRWMAEEHPEAHGYWPAQAVANHALGGVAVLDIASAFSVSPLYDGTGWSPSALTACGVDGARMPEVADLGAAVGRVDGGAVLASGLIDALGEQLVAGVDAPGDVLVICGATLLTWVVVDEYVEVPGLWTIPHLLPGMFLVGGPSNAGGLFLNWAHRLLAETDQQPTATRVPVWTPYPRGERTPLHDPGRRGGMHVLDLTMGPAAARRAAYEAAGFVVRHHVDLAGGRPRRIVATGGGVRDRAWMQALADATGRPVQLVAVPEGGALGAAFVGRMAAGLETDLTDARRWARAGETVQPREAWRGPTEDRYRRFRELTACEPGAGRGNEQG